MMAEYISVDDGLKTNVKLIDKKCFISKWDFIVGEGSVIRRFYYKGSNSVLNEIVL